MPRTPKNIEYRTEYDPKTNSGRTVAIITNPKQGSTETPQQITPVIAEKPTTAAKPLDLKQKRYVTARVRGASKQGAALIAGAKTPVAASQYANRMSKNVSVQQAIDNALELLEATPEFAVRRLKQIAEQDEEIGAARLASKDILELHGWRKNERPTVSLTVNNAFFGASRNKPVAGQGQA